ncbi:MAG: DUF5610 domain-containing protein [Alkalimonas sp.]|nr:DUF5610 domain-containing protein [Alkalimonas sp.]
MAMNPIPQKSNSPAAAPEKQKKSELATALENRAAKETNKNAQNAAIMAANEKVSLNSNNEGLSLLYKTALEAINKELEPVFGENAAQKIYDSGIDVSPEATAERIVSFATKFYGRYEKMTPDMSDEERLDSFLNIIGGAIDQGFTEAKDILKGLNVYEGEIENSVDQTYDFVLKGLAKFRERMEEVSQKKAETRAEAQDEESNTGQQD